MGMSFMWGWSAALLLVLAVAVACSSGQDTQRVQELEQQVNALQQRLTRLSYSIASGGGVNRKMLPDPITGLPTVPLEEVFSFDRQHAICRVDTNARAFQLPTFELGLVEVEPNQFFMSMVATSIEQYQVDTLPDGKRTVTMRGGLDCSTEVGQGKIQIGSRAAVEHATYLIEAVRSGSGNLNRGISGIAA